MAKDVQIVQHGELFSFGWIVVAAVSLLLIEAGEWLRKQLARVDWGEVNELIGGFLVLLLALMFIGPIMLCLWFKDRWLEWREFLAQEKASAGEALWDAH